MLKQKLTQLFSFLWNEFPNRYSSKAVFIYTIVTTVMVWGPLLLAMCTNSPSGDVDGLYLISLYNLFASVVFNTLFGVFFYILLYYENKHRDFRIKNSPINKFYRAVLVFIFLVFTFSFIISIFDIIFSLLTDNTEFIIEAAGIALQGWYEMFFDFIQSVLLFKF